MAEQVTVKFHEYKIPSKGTVVLFAAGKKNTGPGLAKLDKQCNGQISRAIEVSSFEGDKGKHIEILSPANLELARILLIGVGNREISSEFDWMNIGGKISALVKGDPEGTVTILVDQETGRHAITPENCAALATGFQLARYRFDKYKKAADKNGKNKHRVKTLNIAVNEPDKAERAYTRLDATRAGVFVARDLVNEPGNSLGPVEFAHRTRKLEKLGVSVKILDENEMAGLGMNALLAVGQGSEQESRLAVMQWNGLDSKDKPLAIVGKGVSFDSGGISIKPSSGMEDMKGDMGGAACVTGLMHTLARRKAKVNVVGVIGLVENMPDGKAQRPGDVVTSMSGQTIEVINTDAEGRLVLADALTYTIETLKPRLVIDLATLTGAILVALGKEYAGLFSNNDRLAGRLLKAGEKSGEKLWRMPLGKKYDKLIDSRIADMKNTGGRLAGSTTAAQFLKRYVGETPWAHIDIAGTAMSSPKTDINTSWGSGFGVRLLDRFIEENYE